MARGALKWSFEDLAKAAGVSRMTVARFESGKDIAGDSLEAMQTALEAQGVQFGRKAGRLSVSVPENK